MSHNITERDSMFTVREAAWHGLGTVLTDYPTRAEAQAAVLPWEPVTEPVFRRVPGFDEKGEPTVTFEPIEEFRANVRSDDNSVLGLTSAAYETVTNGEMFDIAELLQGEGEAVRYETGGSLKGGAKVWLLLRLNEPLTVLGDPHGATIPYYALQNAHDGSGAFRGQATMTRIVCDNTSQLADMDAQARGTEFTFRHTKNIKERVEEAKAALAGWRDSIQRWKLLSEALLDAKVEEEAVLMFVEKFIPMPTLGVSERVQDNVRKAQLELLTIINSETCEGIGHTAYGLVQAATEYQQHYRKSQSGESRFKRAYLDRSDVLVQAQDLVADLVGVPALRATPVAV